MCSHRAGTHLTASRAWAASSGCVEARQQRSSDAPAPMAAAAMPPIAPYAIELLLGLGGGGAAG